MATNKDSKSAAQKTEQAKALSWFDKYLRYTDYIAAAQLYLKDNFLLKRPLTKDHIKDRILGHWGTVPGLSFIYAHCSYLIKKHSLDMLYIAGPGHGAPAVLANVFAEGAMGDFYEQYQRNLKGMSQIIKDFSWPGGLPSHVTPMTPGGILEGGELGYSLSTAYGAVMDNPNLIVTCVVGDGEAESGPLAAAWHSNKFLNAKESGAVLPIIHVNGYKISGPTIYGTMNDREMESLFTGFGYQVKIVEGANMHVKMMEAMEWAYGEIKKIQKKARSGGSVLSPHWPMIVLRSLKGWGGIKNLDGKKVEGNFRAHGIPLGDPKTNPEHLKVLEHWLRSYDIAGLVDSRGCPKPEVLEFVPDGNMRMGKNANAIGGNVRKPLKFPDMKAYEVYLKGHRGKEYASNTAVGAAFIRDIFKENDDNRNFRFMCPDETDSNKMGALFEQTGRAYVWPLHSYDEFMSTNGRVMEMLSEHTLQGWLQGYLMTGRHGMFATYEAFAMIVASMVDQYAKFIKQASKVPWRKPLSCLNYLLTSLGWRQEHNGFSHQNPGFVSAVLEKHGEFSSVYFPADANSFLVTLEDCFKRKDAINVMVVGKTPLPQWLTLDEAKKQNKKGAGVWEWAHKGSADPDVVISSAGDYMTVEAMAAITILKKMVPELNLRYVNVSELTSLGIGDERCPMGLGNKDFEKMFTADKPIIFNFHGYPGVINKLIFGHPHAERFSVHGYSEEGTTTTPFDMHVRNKTSRFHLAIDAIQKGAEVNEAVAKKAPKLIKTLEDKLLKHQKYIRKYGKDMDEIDEWRWE